MIGTQSDVQNNSIDITDTIHHLIIFNKIQNNKQIMKPTAPKVEAVLALLKLQNYQSA